tara:strand:+ start:889 stop:1011 length:123 start_codon:yes stop_codon:yes gene_type:complete
MQEKKDDTRKKTRKEKRKTKKRKQASSIQLFISINLKRKS